MSKQFDARKFANEHIWKYATPTDDKVIEALESAYRAGQVDTRERIEDLCCDWDATTSDR